MKWLIHIIFLSMAFFLSLNASSDSSFSLHHQKYPTFVICKDTNTIQIFGPGVWPLKNGCQNYLFYKNDFVFYAYFKNYILILKPTNQIHSRYSEKILMDTPKMDIHISNNFYQFIYSYYLVDKTTKQVVLSGYTHLKKFSLRLILPDLIVKNLIQDQPTELNADHILPE